MSRPVASGIPITEEEKDLLHQHVTAGRTDQLRRLLLDLAEEKLKTVAQVILEAREARGGTIAHRAAEYNNHAVIDLICDGLGLSPGSRLAVLNAQEPGKRTAASIAAQYNAVDVLRSLIRGGASLVIKDTMNSVPLHRAVMHGHTLSMVTILSVGSEQCGINIQTVSGQTPLHMALHKGDTLRAGLLIRAGADVELQTMAGATALHLSVPLWTESNDDPAFNDMMHAHFMRIINARGTGPNGKCDLTIEDAYGMAAKDIAVDLEHWKVLNFLLINGA